MSTAAAAAAGTTRAVRGILLMLVATVANTGMNVCARILSADLHPFEVVFFRCLFGLLVISPLLFRYGVASLRTSRLGLHATRSVINVTAALLFYLAISLIPLATVTALDFSAPIFAAILAMIFMGEPARLHRIGALLLGLFGVLMVLRPDAHGFEPGAIFMLLSSLAWGVTLIVIKILSRTETSLTTTVYAGLFTTPCALIVAIPVWKTPSLELLPLLVLLGICGGIGQFCLTQSLRDANLTVVLPIDFTKLVWAAFLGFVLFAEIPDIWTILGGGVIFASACYIALRERKAA